MRPLTPSTLVPNDPSPQRPVVGFRSEEAFAKTPGWYHHPRGQLIWSPDRIQYVQTRDGVWVTPSVGAVWIPANVLHRTHTPHEHNLSFEPGVCDVMPSKPCLVRMTPALAQAFRATLHAISQHQDSSSYLSTWRHAIRDTAISPLPDPLPRAADSSMTNWAAAVEANPHISLADWSRRTHRSTSELTSALLLATGTSFRAWRRRLLLRIATQLMAEGMSVRDAGSRVGYRSTSHFVAAFRALVGTTPARYFDPLFDDVARLAQPEVKAPGITAPAPTPLSSLLQLCVFDHPEGKHNGVHTHDCGELNWPVGVQSVSTARGTWVGSSALAIWLPPGCEHETLIWSRVRACLIHADATHALPRHPCAVRVTPAFERALQDLDPTHPFELRERAAHTIVQHLTDAGISPLPLRMLEPQRLEPLVHALRVDPAIDSTLARWASRLGLSRRTLLRLFDAELGMTFGQLRRLMQVRRAVELMTLGSSVVSASARVGYQSQHKFIRAFRGLVGITPARYVKHCQGTDSKQPLTITGQTPSLGGSAPKTLTTT